MRIDWLWFAVGILFAMFILPMVMGLFAKSKGKAAS